MPKYKFVVIGPWKSSLEDDGEEFHSKWNHKSDWDKGEYNLQWITEDAAKYYYDNCDGWEGWKEGDTQVFDIYSEDDELLGTFDVFLESEPVFSALKNK